MLPLLKRTVQFGLADSFLLFGTLLLGTWVSGESRAEEIDFQRDIRPLLASQCFTCHGPDEAVREAGLRLDLLSGATEDLGGYRAIEPGDRSRSELWARVTSHDSETRMPPGDSVQPLTEDQLDRIGRWIDDGAEYTEHWTFVPPARRRIPDVPDGTACAGPIDRMITARLSHVGLEPSPPADRYSLVRRVYLDLVGIPPTPEEADRFVNDRSPMAYERLVDALLATPEYAERWARPWLDLARYADTNGYEKDRPRTIWPYRDWVLRAIGADMPFDEFSIRQLAGDMLPDASEDDWVATGFHRNTMLNEEGGIDPLEFRFHAMTDRVATVGTVWLGLTVGCAQCHTHKYDPITYTDYFAMMALLNNADEPEFELKQGGWVEERAAIESEIRLLEDEWIADRLDPQTGSAEVLGAFERWDDKITQRASAWQVIRPTEMSSTMPWLRLLDDGSILASGDVTKRDVYRFGIAPSPELTRRFEQITAIRLEVLPHESLPAGGPGLAYYEGRRGDFFLSELEIKAGGKALAMRDATHSYGKISVGSGGADAASVIDGEGSTGWSTSGNEGMANAWVANFAEPVASNEPLEITLLFERHFAAALGRFRFSVVGRDGDAVALPIDAELEAFVASRGDAPATEQASQAHELKRRFLQTAEEVEEDFQAIRRRRADMPESVRTLVMRERTENPRVTHRHTRGEYLRPSEVVEPAIPEMFASSTLKDRGLDGESPSDRLQLARWLVSQANPLVARVTADRAWRELFGRGIVDTAGDYGTQSEPPSHPELLDHLAADLVEGGWSIKRLHRRLVMSQAYRRSSHHRDVIRQSDPENRLLAIGPRRRLEAERIRDSMLAASGLLVREYGGPSVFPPQPESVTALAYGRETWNPSTGGDRYRRSLYTFAKRTAPFAAYAVFDGPTGEVCLPRREISTSPLQSLTLMNDQMYVDMARALAEAVLRDGNESQGFPTADALATALFRRLLVRPPTQDELTAVVEFYHSLADDRGTSSDGPAEAPNRNAWSLVARALLNLDEAITTP